MTLIAKSMNPSHNATGVFPDAMASVLNIIDEGIRGL